ncbi:Na-translocating system protein MpsC family protein [Neobacillus cucumis]|uniref:Na-translocating system protein MpsC family protein n=1 Tax=Neobacillus cucumis TaxID=1740721 RepID=UPI002E2404A7|nr:Na-translocating system protein MpsC family protein [Neobacillus cucumis]
MATPIQPKLMEISSFISKLLRKNFGKGPLSCHAFAKSRFFVLYIREFLSPMEIVLIENKDINNAKISRDIVMKTILTELKGILELEFQQDVGSLYHDWNYLNNTGMITVVFEKEVSSFEPVGQIPEYNGFIDEIERLSILTEKKPDKIEAFQITPKLFLVKRYGILVPIEKALIQNGYEQALLVTKDKLEKTYLHQHGRFEEIFKKPITDIFVDWNLKEDRSLTYFFLS